MDSRTDHGVLTLALILSAAGPLVRGAAAQASTDSLPPDVTPAMVTDGKKIFGGVGLCLACHGPDAKGAIGPDLTDDKWLHGGGAYLEIMARVKSGTDLADSKTGQIMPPMGGASLSDAQLKAVAAYVWSLSHRRGKK